MSEKTAKTNQSVEKVLQIIEAMANAQEPLRLIELSRRVDMPASTTLRMLITLIDRGYAYQDQSTLQYGLTLRFAQIGNLVSDQINIRTIAHPILRELSAKCNESACLAIEDDMEVTYIDVVDGPDSMLKITQRIGKRAPMHSTGVGKLMLTQYTPERLRLLSERKGLTALTPNTATSIAALERELEIVRARGYAIDDEECELGARCVAAPIIDYKNRIVAAISVSGPTFRITRSQAEGLAPVVIKAAREIGKVLAH